MADKKKPKKSSDITADILKAATEGDPDARRFVIHSLNAEAEKQGMKGFLKQYVANAAHRGSPLDDRRYLLGLFSAIQGAEDVSSYPEGKEDAQQLAENGGSLNLLKVVKVAAANISGKAAEDLTLEQALQILEQEDPNPAISAAIYKIADDTAAQIPDEQWAEFAEQMKTARNTGTLYKTGLSLLKQYPQLAEAAFADRVSLFRGIAIACGIYNPKDDPNAPEFVVEAYKSALGNMDEVAAILEKVGPPDNPKEDTATADDTGSEPNADVFRDTITGIAKSALSALNGIREFLASDAYKAIKENVNYIAHFLSEHREEIDILSKSTEELQSLAPFIALELKEAGFTDITLEEILEQGFDEDGNVIPDSPFAQIIERAIQRQEDFHAAEDTIETVEQAAEELPRIISNPVDLLTYPLDKPNSKIWNLLTATDPNGQIKIEFGTGKRGSKQDAIVYYEIDFDKLETGLKISKHLTPFDKRVYIAAAALYNSGNDTTTVSNIHRMMGNTQAPNGEQAKKINDSLTKMGAAHIYLDNTQEVQVNKNYTRFRYDASVLPFERITAYINNTLTNSAVHLFREPPLITFARERKQITTLPRQLLDSPISKTDANLMLEDYLLERISHMKHPHSKVSRKMLLSTIYEQCGIKTRSQRSRAKEKIQTYLDHYKKSDWIADYTMDKDSVTIVL